MADVDDFPLIPDPEPPVDPDADLAAAEASLFADEGEGTGEDAPRPFGRTPLFDFEAGRFVRAGNAPVWVTGLDALKQKLLMAAYTERFEHPEVFTDEFGMVGREDPIGEAADLEEAMSDWAAALEEAWLNIDRVVAVEGIAPRFDPAQKAIFVGPITVITDDDNDEFRIGPLAVAIGEE